MTLFFSEVICFKDLCFYMYYNSNTVDICQSLTGLTGLGSFQFGVVFRGLGSEFNSGQSECSWSGVLLGACVVPCCRGGNEVDE